MRITDFTLFKTMCYLDGKWSGAGDGATIDVLNPASGEILGTVPRCGAGETAAAIAAAAGAMAGWKALTAQERAKYLHALYDLIADNLDELAAILTLEQGKPLAEAKAEIMQGASYFPWYAEEARRAYGRVIPTPGKGKRPLTILQPVGVTGIITPWNFPFSMIPRKAAPALAAGCTVLVKPASQTPYSALALACLAERAGVPAGVFNVITGDSAAIGGELTANPAVRKLSFTGSTAVGKRLMAQCAGSVKRVSLELGGNAPLIVFDDADLEAAASGALGAKFRNSGQTCICANRILVQAAAHEGFVDRLVARVAQLKLGGGLEAGVTQGPLIDEAAVSHMEALVADALSNGAVLATGGKRSELGGLFFEPTVLTGVTPSMRVFREEIFGPIAPITTFATEREAVELANDTEYGLASYLFTRDLGRAWRVSEALAFGMVGVNEVFFGHGRGPVRRGQGERTRPRGRQRGHPGLHGHEIRPDGRDRGLIAGWRRTSPQPEVILDAWPRRS